MHAPVCAACRRRYEGVFICALELESFPFDAQAFDIRIQMGKDKVSGAILSLTNGYKLEHNPNFPNMIASQISDEYEFRPLRYSLSVTSRLESPEPRCEYMISIPASRKSGYYLSNHYFFVLLMFFFSFTFFVLPVDDIANRIMNNMVRGAARPRARPHALAAIRVCVHGRAARR